MISADKKDTSYFDLFFALLAGALIAFLTYFLFEGMVQVRRFYTQGPLWVRYAPILLIPLILVVLQVVKRNSLYFPTKITEFKSTVQNPGTISPMMSLYHLVGTLLSHLSGASLGRESAAVLMSAGLASLFRLNWTFWSVILAGIGFSSATGSSLAGVFFATELIKTQIKQKVFILLGSMVAVNILMTLRHSPLLPMMPEDVQVGFWSKLGLVICLGLAAGWMIKLYKYAYFKIGKLIETKTSWRFVIAFAVGLVFCLPFFSTYQGLGQDALSTLNVNQKHFDFVFLKMALTLLSGAVGLWGGEFVPLVVSGFVFGQSLALALGFSVVLGGYLGAYLLFSSATRLKWTAICLALTVMGISWIFWVYLVSSLAGSIAGPSSIYDDEHETN